MTTTDRQQRAFAPFPLGGREILLQRPTEGQFLVLSRLPAMIEKDRKLDAMMTFGDILEELIVEDEDRRYAYHGLVNGTIGMNEYLQLVVLLLNYMKEQAEDAAPTTGPAPRKRATPRRR